MNNLNNLIGFIDDVNNVGRRRSQQYKDRPNYYNILGDDEFIYRFRLSKPYFKTSSTNNFSSDNVKFACLSLFSLFIFN